MPGAGELLRQARESQGLPLDEIARGTHIRVEYLAAIEDNNFAQLPGDVYTRGFLRNYASFVGLNPQDVIVAYEVGSDPPRRRPLMGTPMPPRRRSPDPIRIQPLSPTPIDMRVRYAPSFWLMGLVAFVLLILVYLGYNTLNGIRQASLPEATPTPLRLTPTAVVAGLPTAVVGNTPVFTPFPTPGPSATPDRPGGLPQGLPLPPNPAITPLGPGGTTPPPIPAVPAPTITTAPPPPPPVLALPTPTITLPTGAVTVQVTIGSQNAWIQVMNSDGKVQFRGTLAAGAVQSWTAQEKIRIRTGRGDLVAVTVNGMDKGLMSDAAQMVVTKEWDAAGNERIIP